MNLRKMIQELQDEKVRLEEAITTLIRLAQGNGEKRRGRPPAYLAKQKEALVPAELPKRMNHRHPFTKATRKKMAAAQKKRWAAARKKAKA